MRNGSENSISESHFRGGVFPTPLAISPVFAGTTSNLWIFRSQAGSSLSPICPSSPYKGGDDGRRVSALFRADTGGHGTTDDEWR